MSIFLTKYCRNSTKRSQQEKVPFHTGQQKIVFLTNKIFKNHRRCPKLFENNQRVNHKTFGDIRNAQLLDF